MKIPRNSPSPSYSAPALFRALWRQWRWSLFVIVHARPDVTNPCQPTNWQIFCWFGSLARPMWLCPCLHYDKTKYTHAQFFPEAILYIFKLFEILILWGVGKDGKWAFSNEFIPFQSWQSIRYNMLWSMNCCLFTVFFNVLNYNHPF